jgi:hypothetical protein
MNVLRDRIARLKKGDDRGNEFVSWLALIVIAAAIFAFLMTLKVPQTIGDAASNKIKEVAGTGASAAPAPAGTKKAPVR